MPFAQFPMHQKSGYLSKHHRLDPDTKGYQPNFQVVGVSSFEGLSVCRSLQYLGRSKTLLAHYAKRNWTCYSVRPNSTGSFVGVSAKARWGFESPTGVFGASDVQQVRSADSLPQDRERSTVLTMSLAKQNSLFGSSDTVQPKTLRAQFLIRYE